jgi:Arabinose efflux permease
MNSFFPGVAQQGPPVNPLSQPQPRPRWLLVGPALTASLGAFLLTLTTGPEWTAIRENLALSTSMVLWVFVAYLMPALLAVPVGALVGRRWPTAVTLSAIVLMVPGSLLIMLTPGAAALLLGRALTGLGAGLAWGVTAALVAQVARVGTYRWVVALVVGAVVLALLLGPAVAALLARTLTWRTPFLLAVPFGAVAFLVAAVSGLIALVRRQPSRPAQPPVAPPG